MPSLTACNPAYYNQQNLAIFYRIMLIHYHSKVSEERGGAVLFFFFGCGTAHRLRDCWTYVFLFFTFSSCWSFHPRLYLRCLAFLGRILAWPACNRGCIYMGVFPSLPLLCSVSPAPIVQVYLLPLASGDTRTSVGLGWIRWCGSVVFNLSSVDMYVHTQL